LVSARVLEHKPAAVQPLDAVKAEVEKLLVREEAAKLAIKDGEAKLARLQKGEAVELKWSPSARDPAQRAAGPVHRNPCGSIFKRRCRQVAGLRRHGLMPARVTPCIESTRCKQGWRSRQGRSARGLLAAGNMPAPSPKRNLPPGWQACGTSIR
jgi:hypothetical protein